VTALLDVNLLVSLAWPNHVHHRRALTWFRQRRGQPWATTPFTEAGFVRVSSNASAIATAVTPKEAIAMLRRLRSLAGHRFLLDDVGLVFGGHLEPARVSSYRLVTDGHLLALARRHGASLATLDSWLPALAGDGEAVMLVSGEAASPDR
jgi:toxin-antitoxin system PIN domain toxin